MIDLGAFGHISFDLAFLSALFGIVLIDLILAGDNAVVIAMAARSLPHDQRKKGIIFGAGAAVLLRVALTFFVAQLLVLSYVKLIGGLLIHWIAVKLFAEARPRTDTTDRPERSGRPARPSSLPTSPCRLTTCWQGAAK